MATRAQKFIELRERYRGEALTLRKQTRFSSDREERQTFGRIETLERVADELSTIAEGMKPTRVQAVVEGILALLAEHKATWIVNYIRERRRFGINELGQWTGEGAIGQIDEISVQLCSRLSPAWNLSSPQRQGKYYHVYHSLDLATTLDVEQVKERWRSQEQAQWYREVAIIQVEQASGQVEQVYRLTNHGHHGWEANPEVFWVQKDATHRSTSVGDVIVSVLSETAWVVCNAGFEVIEPREEGSN
jgi:hypothetical protein